MTNDAFNHVCKNDPCDGCRTCRSGRCCRRDNPNDQLPVLGAWDGPIFGELGRINADGEKQECHCCGKWFVALGTHAYHAHNLTGHEYRAIFGLRAGTKLAGGDLRDHMRRVNGRRLAAARPLPSTLLNLTPEQRRSQARKPRRLESLLDPRVRGMRKAALQNALRKQRQLRAEGKLQVPAALRHQSPELQAAYFNWVAHRQQDDERQYARTAILMMLDACGLQDASETEIAGRVTTQTFRRYGLMGILDAVYNWSAYAALVDLYPTLRPWQMSSAPQAYWTGEQGREHGREAMRWMIEQMGLADAPAQHVAQELTVATFRRYGLGGMLEHVYENEIGAALSDLYPTLLPWQRRAPQGYWTGEDGRHHAAMATRWMLAQMGLSDAPSAVIARQISLKTFELHGLGGMLVCVYGGNVYAALHELMPDLHPWQMRTAPQGYWRGPDGKQHAREALRWLLAQRGLVDAPLDEVRRQITWQVLVDSGLRMIPRMYGTTEAALRDMFEAYDSVDSDRTIPQT